MLNIFKCCFGPRIASKAYFRARSTDSDGKNHGESEFVRQQPFTCEELEKEKWSQNTEQVEKMATEALEEYSKMKEETEKELESIEI